jgi:hypothetical protein
MINIVLLPGIETRWLGGIAEYAVTCIETMTKSLGIVGPVVNINRKVSSRMEETNERI